MELIIAILAFGIMLTVHEFGHFIMAKSFGMTVHEFSIGMGPSLFSRKKGETLYSLRAIPFGAYVMLESEDGEEDLDEDLDESDEEEATLEQADETMPSNALQQVNFEEVELEETEKKDEPHSLPEKDGSFATKPIWQRFIVLVAGAAMNILLGFILCCVLVLRIGGYNKVEVAGFREGAVSNQKLMVGDKILKVEGKKVSSVLDFTSAFLGVEDPFVNITVRRDDKVVELSEVPFLMEKDEKSGMQYLQYDFFWTAVRVNPANMFVGGYQYTVGMAKTVWISVRQLVTGQVGIQQMSGPVGVATELTNTLKMGLSDFIAVCALITVNLGIMNLLPFPALDGGRILFLGVEKLIGRPVSKKVQTVITMVGMLLLFSLMILLTMKDVWNLIQ